MGNWERQKDIDAEGQRAAIYHGSKNKGGHNSEFQVKNRPPAPMPTRTANVDTLRPSRDEVVAEIMRLCQLLA